MKLLAASSISTRSRHSHQISPHQNTDSYVCIPTAPPVAPSLMLFFTRLPAPLEVAHLLPEVLVDVVAQQRGVTTHVAVAVLQAKLRGTSRGRKGRNSSMGGRRQKKTPTEGAEERGTNNPLAHLPPCGQKDARHSLAYRCTGALVCGGSQRNTETRLLQVLGVYPEYEQRQSSRVQRRPHEQQRLRPRSHQPTPNPREILQKRHYNEAYRQNQGYTRMQ